jgi:RNA recognition motif-containing protein
MMAHKSNQKAAVSCRIFVGGVPIKMDESMPLIYLETLRDYFSVYGQVSYLKLAKNKKTKEPLGFGFLEFTDEEVSEIVLNEKHMINGREVSR